MTCTNPAQLGRLSFFDTQSTLRCAAAQILNISINIVLVFVVIQGHYGEWIEVINDGDIFPVT